MGLAVAVVVLLALLIRKTFVPATNGDFEIFAHWYDFVRSHGISSLQYGAEEGFSNYNPTYNYFLIGTALVGIPKLLAIKGLMIIFDMLLAFSVYLLSIQLGKGKKASLGFALASMFLPTVLATGAFWGQFDQFYTAFIFFSLWALLARKSKTAWMFFGVAISIKLQAIFFLPVLVIMMFRRIKWWDAWAGATAFSVLTFSPMFFGRPLSSLLHVYTTQTTLFKGNLQMSAPNIYQWLPNAQFDLFNKAGVYLTIAVLAGIFLHAIYYKKFSRRDALLLTAVMLYLVPFLLPQMHERYFFSATVASAVALLVIPRLWLVALSMQVVTLFSYMPFLFNQQPPIPFAVLPLFSMAMLGGLWYEYAKPDEGLSSKKRVADAKTRKNSLVRAVD